jgi:hypothetical protein
MSLAVVHSRGLVGVDAPPVSVEVHLANGLPAFHIVGLPDTEVRESRERVRAALLHCGFEFPNRRITVNLAPADLPKGSGRFDLPIAVGILAAAAGLPPHRLEAVELMGELSLNGDLRPVRGALVLALALRRAALHRLLILPAASAADAAPAGYPGTRAARTLREVWDALLEGRTVRRVSVLSDAPGRERSRAASGRGSRSWPRCRSMSNMYLSRCTHLRRPSPPAITSVAPCSKRSLLRPNQSGELIGPSDRSIAELLRDLLPSTRRARRKGGNPLPDQIHVIRAPRIKMATFDQCLAMHTPLPVGTVRKAGVVHRSVLAPDIAHPEERPPRTKAGRVDQRGGLTAGDAVSGGIDPDSNACIFVFDRLQPRLGKPFPEDIEHDKCELLQLHSRPVSRQCWFGCVAARGRHSHALRIRLIRPVTTIFLRRRCSTLRHAHLCGQPGMLPDRLPRSTNLGV